MDPKVMVRAFADAMANNDFDAMDESARDLCEWLWAGGFEPDWGAEGKAVESALRSCVYRDDEGGRWRWTFCPAGEAL